MTLFDLVIRSMRKNLKHYYLYFFALIVSVVLYFVFASLQHDTSVVELAASSVNKAATFKAAGVLLLVIAGVFVLYANSIFMKRRSREIGLYQLIGLSKFTVGRMLITENLLMGTGALAIGIGIGLLVSRVFLLLLMKLTHIEGVLTMSFSLAAVVQTAVVFLVLLLLTSFQMIISVKRSTLSNLFKADQAGERIKKPKSWLSAMFAVLGVLLITFGYWLSGRMLNELLFYNMLAVLGSVILGTYLLFRVTIGWLFYRIRTSKNGHLGLSNSLSLAPLMHRMRANANSLTLITVLSALTLTLLAAAYSSYYSAEKETRLMQPFDYMIEEDEAAAGEFTQALADAGIGFKASPIEAIEVDAGYETAPSPLLEGVQMSFRIVSEQQLKEAGLKEELKDPGEGILMDGSIYWLLKSAMPQNLIIDPDGAKETIHVEHMAEGNAFNMIDFSSALAVSEKDYQTMKQKYLGQDETRLYRTEAVNITDDQRLEAASAIYSQINSEGKKFDYYTQYQEMLESSGLLIFIGGFLGFVFLISTGSILYFKQMTEAEQEKASYTTLRQLGFSVQEIMKGIRKKQLFVFGLPLLIGLLHSIFAIKSASFLFMTDTTIPTVTAMGIYIVIYLVFAILTIGYYKKVVRAAL